MAKLEKNTNQNRMSESVIGSEMEIIGDIKCNGIMRVVGKLKGTINCSDLIVEENANVKATISANSVSVNGNVSGVIKTQAIEISSNASFNGELFYERIAIDSGANMEAKLNYDPSGEKAQKYPKPKSPETDTIESKEETQTSLKTS